MDEDPRCQRCGVALAGQAVGELCANCLLGLALEPPAEPTAAGDELDLASPGPNRVRYFGDYELVEEIARGGMGVFTTTLWTQVLAAPRNEKALASLCRK